MTKKFKRAISLILAFAMVMALGVSSWANSKITIDESSETHTYYVYQIFKGTLDGTELQNIEWGSSVDIGTSTVTAAAAAEALAASGLGTTTSASVLTNYDGDEIVDWFESEYGIDVDKTVYGTITYSSGYSLSDVPDGYYLIVDTMSTGSETGTKEDTISSYVIAIVGADETLYPKKDTATVDKKVKDVNDTTGDESDWATSADYDIGDSVPFMVTANMPSNITDYDVYYMLFTDTMSDGLTYNDDMVVTVYLDGNTTNEDGSNKITLTLTTDYTVTDSTATDDTIKVAIADLLSSVSGVNSDTIVVLTYSATLNANAVIGNSGNDNTVKLTYTNNPNTTGDGSTETTDTPDDTVKVFTYELDATKVDAATGDALNGAGFTLYKKLSTSMDSITSGGTSVTYSSDGTTYESSTPGTTPYYVNVDNTIYYYDGSAAYEYVATINSSDKELISDTINDIIIAGTTVTYSSDGTTYDSSAPGTTPYYVNVDGTIYYYDGTNTYKLVGNIFKFEGIDDGTYMLVESTVPAGYNKMDDLVFTVTAEHDENEITSLSTNVASISGTAGTGTLSTTIENSSGETLPETGGMGTKLFYTLGGILVVGAGILLIVKRRMRNA